MRPLPTPYSHFPHCINVLRKRAIKSLLKINNVMDTFFLSNSKKVFTTLKTVLAISPLKSMIAQKKTDRKLKLLF